ncbi:YdcF family protein [Cohnella nanjingensis]|uniref:YdcF family protein n=1 Tax=Cohnella nanjingensis TaxID=1387779 RepID=A0A7X0RKK7_9BACL|nr:YdcF family protein [Cohnella nanjingensis]MBB6669155.1 YdcF family protein [Cohnella nanjingensis]
MGERKPMNAGRPDHSAEPLAVMKHPKRKRAIRAIAAIALVGVIALAAWCAAIYVHIARFEGLPADSAPRHADVGIVLGASLWQDKPSPGLRERLDLGLSLYRAGTFDRFILTGGLDDNGATITEAEGMKRYLVGQGVPAEAIALDPDSRSTYENLSFAQAIMAERGWRTAVIVTHQFHGARALDIAQTLRYRDVQVQVTPSRVMNMAYHNTREVLAYTKWLGQKWLLHAA